MLNSDCEYLTGLRQKYASTLGRNPAALSNRLTHELDQGAFDRSYENVTKSAGNTPVRPEHADVTISSVSNDVSPPAPVQRQVQPLRTTETDKENQPRGANRPPVAAAFEVVPPGQMPSFDNYVSCPKGRQPLRNN